MANLNLDIPIMVSGVGFVVVLLTMLGILQLYKELTKKKALVEKIHTYSDERGDAGPIRPENGNEKKTRTKITELLGSLGERFFPDQSKDDRQNKLKFLRAGLRRRNVPAVFWGTKFFLMLLFPACFLMTRITVFKLLSVQWSVSICIILAVVGLYLPDIWLSMKTRKRKKVIFNGLPDALDLLVVCVEAGMGLDGAINRVAEEMKLSNDVLSDEFRYVNLEMRAGKSRHDALKNLAYRVDMEDISTLVTVLIQSDKFGTSMAQALRVHSDAFRTKRYQRAEELAAKLPVKLVLPLILFIFPSLFVTILGPAAIRLYQVLISR